jgi:hypothetical protein
MKTIKMLGRYIKISIDEERALRILRGNDYAVTRSLLYWSSRRSRRYLIDAEFLPLRDRIVRAERRKLLGIYTSPRRNLAEEARDAELMPKLAKRFKRDSESPAGKREARFFEAHRRASDGYFGNPRRVNLILQKLEEAE